jgi:hypothetical protein
MVQPLSLSELELDPRSLLESELDPPFLSPLLSHLQMQKLLPSLSQPALTFSSQKPLHWPLLKLMMKQTLMN